MVAGALYNPKSLSSATPEAPVNAMRTAFPVAKKLYHLSLPIPGLSTELVPVVKLTEIED